MQNGKFFAHIDVMLLEVQIYKTLSGHWHPQIGTSQLSIKTRETPPICTCKTTTTEKNQLFTSTVVPTHIYIYIYMYPPFPTNFTLSTH